MKPTRASSAARFAIYWAPPEGSPLAKLGAAWLDGAPGTVLPALDPGRRQALTAAPRHYGLHATLKPPFFLDAGRTEAELCEALEGFAASLTCFAVPHLRLAVLDGFIALIPSAPCPALDRLAAQCVSEFDAFRRAAPPEELARRRAAGLTERQERNLLRWGYPYVLDDFRFHVTLTGRIERGEANTLLDQLGHAFEPVIGTAFEVSEIVLFTQNSADAPFHQKRRFKFGGMPS
jgi:putative phosphonate metabolism protein